MAVSKREFSALFRKREYSLSARNIYSRLRVLDSLLSKAEVGSIIFGEFEVGRRVVTCLFLFSQVQDLS